MRAGGSLPLTVCTLAGGTEGGGLGGALASTADSLAAGHTQRGQVTVAANYFDCFIVSYDSIIPEY